MLLAKDNQVFTAWHQTALNGRLEASETLLSFAKNAELNPDELFLAQIEEGGTAFHREANGNRVDVLKKIWDCAEEEQLLSKELKKKLFLAKDNKWYTAWHRPALLGSLEAMEIFCIWANEV